ncbi:molybdenum cofactor sulfurase 2 isoform X2 [Athalia rosae]|uniref:molybdenum cofactor sulfurase 2 isoform X2 n=1 Tax=Athalia rosae TaxID=37344 RepID=UPI002033BF8A|nr:molybdenum cofactor sulfurase 2 isoform X2 [Athalia rosae]
MNARPTVEKDDCYLDHAGATMYSKSQMRNVADDLSSNLYGNPHSLGTASRLTHDVVDQMRFRILDHFRTNSDEYSVIFTSGATASLKLVSETFNFSEDGGANGHFVYLQDNHTSVLGMREVVAQRGVKVICLNHENIFDLFSDAVNTDEKKIRRPVDGINSLFVYPAQCNFSGLKYPLWWIERVRNGKLDSLIDNDRPEWFTFLDAASYVATNKLNLSIHKPDFVCVSFYKIFGYPTGLGALLVRKSAEKTLGKIYYGGGTVEISLSSDMFHSKRPVLHERFEDGTLSFLSIISLRHGFDALSKFPAKVVSRHVFSLARYLHHSLLKLHHANGEPIARLYADTDYEDCQKQGGIVTFNLLRSNGEIVGFVEFLNMANLHKIHLRTGCFCNPGACQRHLELSNEDLKEHFNAGHVCGDQRDLIDGKPTGAIRVSFGYMSRKSDVESLLDMVKKCFLNGPEVIKIPEWWKECKIKVKNNPNKNGIKVANENEPNNEASSIKKQTVDCETIKVVKEVRVEDEIMENEGGFRLKRLFIYPVKSCASYEISNSWIIGDRGLIYDREWMITTPSGVCLTQKQETKMCLVKPIIRQAENSLELNFPGMPSIQVPLKINKLNTEITRTEISQSKICGHRVEGIDCGADVSEWLSLCLGRPGLRLIRQNSESKRIKPVKKPEIAFSSQAQYLLINQASIQWLADRVPPDSGCDRDSILDRFRGNIIIEGGKSFEEMKWEKICIGKTRFQVDGKCTRCQMICIDQSTGNKTVEPLRTLAEEFHGKIRFGIYLSRTTSDSSVIRIGDTLFYK